MTGTFDISPTGFALSVSAMGAFAAALTAGTRLASYFLRRSFHRPPVSIFYPLSITLGLMAVSPILLAAGVIGVFSPSNIGIAGWVFTAVVRPKLLPIPVRAFSRWPTIAVLATALFAVLVSSFLSGEHISGGRDQGFYTNHAIWIARTGKTLVDFPLGLNDPGLIQGIQRGFVDSGLYFTSNGLIGQFPHTYSVWLAQAYSIAGFTGMDVFNGLLAATSVLLFYALARSCMSKFPAIIASVFLCLSPAQLWISKITLTELFGQQAFLATCVFLVWAVRRRCPRLFVVSGLTAAFGYLIRIDGMLLLPPLLVGTASTFLYSGQRLPDARRLFLILCATAVPAFLACAAYYWIDTRPYFLALSQGLAPVAALAAFACIMGLLLRPKLASTFRTLADRSVLRLLVVAVLAAAFLWAYFIRPRFDLSFETFQGVSNQTAAHAFRVNSLWNLGIYLFPPVLFAGVCGLGMILLSPLISRRLVFLIPVGVIWLEYALLLIQDPRISIDHPWTIRRFIPVVIPGFILFAFIAFDFFEQRVGSRKRLFLLRTALSVLLLGFVGFATPPSMFRREYAGSRQFFAELAAKLPSDVPILAHGSLSWTLPLMMSYGKPVFFLDLGNESGLQLARRIANATAGGRCVVIHEYTIPPFEFADSRSEIVWSFERIRPAAYPLALDWERQAIRIMIETFGDASKLLDTKGPRFGAQKMPGVTETGFNGQEFSGSDPFRWTTRSATLEIPVSKGQSIHSIEISFAGIHPHGSDVVVTVNAHRLFANRITAPAGTIPVNGLEGIDLGDRLVLTIESTPFRPVDLGISRDSRELGMRIVNIRLLDDSNRSQVWTGR